MVFIRQHNSTTYCPWSFLPQTCHLSCPSEPYPSYQRQTVLTDQVWFIKKKATICPVWQSNLTSNTHEHSYSYTVIKKKHQVVPFRAKKLVPDGGTLPFVPSRVHLGAVHFVQFGYVIQHNVLPLCFLQYCIIFLVIFFYKVSCDETENWCSLRDKYNTLLPGCTKCSLRNSKLKSPCTYANQKCLVVPCIWIKIAGCTASSCCARFSRTFL